MSDRMLSLSDLVEAYISESLESTLTPEAEIRSDIARAFAAHDHALLKDYESKRSMNPIHIDNIAGESAKVWLTKHDVEVAAKALEDKREADIKTLHALAEGYAKTAERLSDEERYMDSSRYSNYASGLDMAAAALRVQGEQ